MADYNLGRVQGGGIFRSSAASGTSVALSTVSPSTIKPLAGDIIMFLNGDIRGVSSVSSTTVTCGEVIANFKGVEISSISSSGSGFIFTLSDGSSVTVPVNTVQVTEADVVIPVTSVNGKTGAVQLYASDISNLPKFSVHTIVGHNTNATLGYYVVFTFISTTRHTACATQADIWEAIGDSTSSTTRSPSFVATGTATGSQGGGAQIVRIMVASTACSVFTFKNGDFIGTGAGVLTVDEAYCYPLN